MRLFGRLFALFLLVPVAELVLLVEMARHVGLGPTLALVVATAVAGAWLLRREGTGVWRRVQERMAAGALPGRELLDGAIVLVAGVLLLTPGVLTDVAGLLGLFPPTRAVVRRLIERRMRRAVAAGRLRVVGSFGGTAVAPGAPPVEEAEVIEVRPGARGADAA